MPDQLKDALSISSQSPTGDTNLGTEFLYGRGAWTAGAELLDRDGKAV